LRALAKKPEERFANTGAFARAFQQAATQAPSLPATEAPRTFVDQQYKEEAHTTPDNGASHTRNDIQHIPTLLQRQPALLKRGSILLPGLALLIVLASI